ncbi:MAG: hypothetical protein WC402_02975 [Candidatus Pacearchaeota archaeon]|jgi:hypothetical protein
MKKLIFLWLMIFLLTSLVNATSSSLFVDHLSKTIYNDCQNKDIIIKEGYIQNTLTNKSVTILPWQYSYDNVHRIIEILGNYEPYEFFQGSCENKGVSISGIPGCKILSCGDKYLDVNQYTYFWNGVRVDVPKEEFNTYNAQTSGDNSPAVAGNNNNIQQNNKSLLINLFWSKGTIGGLIIGGIIWLLVRIILFEYKKRKTKQKTKKEAS